MPTSYLQQVIERLNSEDDLIQFTNNDVVSYIHTCRHQQLPNVVNENMSVETANGLADLMACEVLKTTFIVQCQIIYKDNHNIIVTIDKISAPKVAYDGVLQSTPSSRMLPSSMISHLNCTLVTYFAAFRSPSFASNYVVTEKVNEMGEYSMSMKSNQDFFASDAIEAHNNALDLYRFTVSRAKEFVPIIIRVQSASAIKRTAAGVALTGTALLAYRNRKAIRNKASDLWQGTKTAASKFHRKITSQRNAEDQVKALEDKKPERSASNESD